MKNLQTDLFSQELVNNIDGELLVSSLVIAENIEYEHRAILQLIRQNLKDFQEFGRVAFEIAPSKNNDTNSAFEMRKSKGRATEYALLNENQSTLLITYLRNSELVKRFKINLVKAFSLMKQKLQASKFDIPQTYSQALLLASKQAQQLQEQKEVLEQQKPKVEFYDVVTQSKDTIDIGTVAKVLNKNIGRNNLFKLLRDKGVLTLNNMPKDEYVKKGYFKVCENKYNLPDGSVKIGLKTVVFQKGLDYINKVLDNQQIGA